MLCFVFFSPPQTLSASVNLRETVRNLAQCNTDCLDDRPELVDYIISLLIAQPNNIIKYYHAGTREPDFKPNTLVANAVQMMQDTNKQNTTTIRQQQQQSPVVGSFSSCCLCVCAAVQVFEKRLCRVCVLCVG